MRHQEIGSDRLYLIHTSVFQRKGNSQLLF
jgi:hypothetical protein